LPWFGCRRRLAAPPHCDSWAPAGQQMWCRRSMP
jgi:hypothetical protein